MSWKDWLQIMLAVLLVFLVPVGCSIILNKGDEMARKENTKFAEGLFEAQREQIKQLKFANETLCSVNTQLQSTNAGLQKRLNKQGTNHAQQQKDLGDERTDIRKAETIIQQQTETLESLGKELKEAKKNLATQRLELFELKEKLQVTPVKVEEPKTGDKHGEFLPSPREAKGELNVTD